MYADYFTRIGLQTCCFQIRQPVFEQAHKVCGKTAPIVSVCAHVNPDSNWNWWRTESLVTCNDSHLKSSPLLLVPKIKSLPPSPLCHFRGINFCEGNLVRRSNEVSGDRGCLKQTYLLQLEASWSIKDNSSSTSNPPPPCLKLSYWTWSNKVCRVCAYKDICPTLWGS